MLIFVSGDGVAAARSLIRAKDVGSLYLNMREEARLYYSAPSPSELAYQVVFLTVGYNFFFFCWLF